MSALSPEKDAIIKKIAKCHDFENYSVKVASGSMKGDGYLGIIHTVEIADDSKVLHLVAKSAQDAEKLRESTPIRKAYEREIFMYETVFPELGNFARERRIAQPFTEIAKCYGSLLTDTKECLFLENLKESDYRLWNRKEPMNQEHVALVFATYAKFHGTGMAYRLLNPDKFEELSKNLVSIFYNEESAEASAAQFAESLKHIFGNGLKTVAHDPKATEALLRFSKTCKKFFDDLLKVPDPYRTILHGDCWCNNMMFKYDDKTNPSRPTNVCLLDWQISNVGSPIFDLSYFFYACSSKEVLYKLKSMLKIYHDVLSRTMQDAGVKAEDIMSYEELENQWKINSGFGLFMALFVMRVILSETSEAPDLSKLAEGGQDLLTSITQASTVNIEMVNKRISDIIIFMVENDYL